MSLTPQLYSTALESNSTEIGWGVLPYNNKEIYIIELLEPRVGNLLKRSRLHLPRTLLHNQQHCYSHGSLIAKRLQCPLYRYWPKQVLLPLV